MADIEQRLLEVDLEMIIVLVRELSAGVACDLEEREKCALSNVERGKQPAKCDTRIVIEYSDLEAVKRRLKQFERRFKELHG
jgi:hypothetical protein